MTALPPQLADAAREHPYPLLFATVSGAHLYGFPSPDSDYDLRGVHVLPPEECLGLDTGPETLTRDEHRDGIHLDLVTHDARKFFGMLLQRNGYVLEQLHSPLVVASAEEHRELLAISAGCVTRHHAHHYLGFAATQWRLFEREDPPRIKPLLYVYRVLLTGIHLMRTGRVVADLPRLASEAGLGHLDALVRAKREGSEDVSLGGADVAVHKAEYLRLVADLERARDESALPDAPSARRALHDLLLRLRLRP